MSLYIKFKKKKKKGEESVSSVLRKKYLVKTNAKFTFGLTIVLVICKLQITKLDVGRIGFIYFSI